MLVVTRKSGESILIGDNIEVSISKIEDGSVKIAIEAPKDIRILRKEIYKQVERENREAAVIDLKVLKDIKK